MFQFLFRHSTTNMKITIYWCETDFFQTGLRCVRRSGTSERFLGKKELMEKLFNSLWWLSQLFGILNICLVLVWTYKFLGGFGWQDDPLHEFNYHPVFAIIGLVFLYGNGLLVYRALRFRQKTTLKSLHIAILFVVFIFTVVSLKTAFDSHNYRTIPIANMYSLHSWVGLGTVILFGMQFLLGFVAFLYPGMKVAFRRNYMQIHQFFGITIFVLAVISCHSGIMEKVKGSLREEYQNLPPPAFVANFLGISITVFAILVIYLASMPQFKRKPLPEEDKLHLELSSCAM